MRHGFFLKISKVIFRFGKKGLQFFNFGKFVEHFKSLKVTGQLSEGSWAGIGSCSPLVLAAVGLGAPQEGPGWRQRDTSPPDRQTASQGGSGRAGANPSGHCSGAFAQTVRCPGPRACHRAGEPGAALRSAWAMAPAQGRRWW